MSQEIRDRLISVVAETFMCDFKDVRLDMTPGDIPRWDSLGHIMLLESIQNGFGIELPLEDALNAASLNDLFKLIEEISSGV